jgi:hypothetical protein
MATTVKTKRMIVAILKSLFQPKLKQMNAHVQYQVDPGAQQTGL